MDSDDKKILENRLEKKRIQTELEHLQKAFKSGIMSKHEYTTAKNTLDKKIKDMDKKLRQAEAKQKAVEEILGAESILTMPRKRHQRYFAKIEKQAEHKKSPEPKKPAEAVVQEVVLQPEISVQKLHSEEIPQEDTNWRFALAVLTIFLIILLYIKFSSSHSTADVVAVDAYLDYTSQYSKDMHAVLVQLQSEYSSQLLMTYHIAGESEQSKEAAHAVFCAGQQERKQEFLDYLFTQEYAEMTAIASAIGLDEHAFTVCMNALFEPETADVDYTPTVLVNNKKIVGAVGYDAVKAVIDAEMTALG